MDLAAILRASSDAPKRETLVRLAAGLGHEEAQRWIQELGLEAIDELPGGAWTALPGERQLEWFCDCLEAAALGLREAGGDVGEGVPAALALVRRRARGEAVGFREEGRVFAVLESEGREFRRLGDAALEAGETKARDLAWLGQTFGVALAGEAIRASRSSRQREDLLRAALRLLGQAVAHSRLAFLGIDTVDAQLHRDPRIAELIDEHHVWRLAHLRDAYLWPEAIRP